jgi:hypothetical protein
MEPYRNPDDLSPAERCQEITAILARGFLRFALDLDGDPGIEPPDPPADDLTPWAAGASIGRGRNSVQRGGNR